MVVLLLICAGIGSFAYAQYFTPSLLPGEAELTQHEEKLLAPLITVEELHDKVVNKDRFILVDARSVESFAHEHVEGAINIPLKELDSKIGTLMPFDQEIVTMCSGGDCELSTKTATKLLEAGFTNVKNYDGGITGWKIKGYLVVTDKNN